MSASDRLSQIETLWSMVYKAHGDALPDQTRAQHELLARYGTAIQRYLLGALKNQAVAEEVYQDFAVKFLRGEFHSANHEKGRFRGFLKVVLSRLVADHFRKSIRRPTKQLDEAIEVADVWESKDREHEFIAVWRDEMLTRAWNDLSAEEIRTGKPWFQVLKLRVENPQWRSAELAEALGHQVAETITAERLRVTLHRARERFSNFLIDAVTETLQSASLEDVEEELADLELLQYCQSAIEKRRQ